MSYEINYCETVQKELANVSADITGIFKEIGIPQNIMGYNYLRVAVQRVVENPQYVQSICKKLYGDIAEIFNTKPARVERCIRTAIETAWSRADLDVIEYYFGNTVSGYSGKPTNSEFICLIANVVREEQCCPHNILKRRLDEMRVHLIDEILCKYSDEYAELLENYKEMQKNGYYVGRKES